MSKFIALINVSKKTSFINEELDYTYKFKDQEINVNVNIVTGNIESTTLNYNNTFFGDTLVKQEVEEINEGYAFRKGRYVKIIGKYSSFARKSEAVSIRSIYEYEHKLKEIKAEHESLTKNVFTEEIGTFQENMTATEEANEYHSVYSITEAKTMPIGTNVVIKGIVDQPNGKGYVETKKLTMGVLQKDGSRIKQKELTIRYFRLVEYGFYIDEMTGQQVRFEKAYIWVKPGVRVTMMKGEEYVVHGVVKRIPTAQPKRNITEVDGEKIITYSGEKIESANMFLTEKEKNEGVSEFTFLSPARFVKYVPEDITGKTGDVMELSEDEIVKTELKGYEWEEVMNPNDLSHHSEEEKNEFVSALMANSTLSPQQKKDAIKWYENHMAELYSWKGRMLKVTKARSWVKANLSEMGGGIEELYTKVVEAEEVIAEHLGEDMLVFVQKLVEEELTGSEEVDVSFKDKDGVNQWAPKEIMEAIKRVEEEYFESERKDFINKAFERLQNHWETTGERNEKGSLNVTGGFWASYIKCSKEDRMMIRKAIKEMKISAWAMSAALKEEKLVGDKKAKYEEGEKPQFEKAYNIETGKEWWESTVLPLANEALSKCPVMFQKHEWLRKGIVNAAFMYRKGDIVPMSTEEYDKAVESIYERALNIKFYGGTASANLWKVFTAWQGIKRLLEKQETGEGHVDDLNKGELSTQLDQRKQQLTAEFKQVKWLSWTWREQE